MALGSGPRNADDRTTQREPLFRPDSRTRRLIGRSRRALLWERLSRALWPGFSAVAVVLGLTFLGFFGVLPAPIHPFFVGAAGLFVLASIIWGFWGFRWPSPAEARGRLDADSSSKPLGILTDAQASGREDATARAIWLEHQRRAERALSSLSARKADPRLSGIDTWALRLFAPVVLLAGLVGANGEWGERLATLLAPPVPPAAAAAAPAFERVPLAEAWVVPPVHTGMGTVYLDRDTTEFTLPEGSDVTLRVTDLDAAPLVDAPGIESELGLQSLGAGLHELRGRLAETGPLTVTNETEAMAGWSITVTPDATPEISLDGEPQGTFAGALELSFEASDDYGVVSAWAEIVPPGGVEPGKGLVEEPITFALPLPITGDPRRVRDRAMQDLSEHPLAGGEVEMVLRAEDGAAQVGESETITFTLPGRRFSNPMARALVEQRRDLSLEFARAPRVLDVLQAITKRPEPVFGEKHGAYLAVRTAIRRLAFAIGDERVPDEAADIAEFLWQAALELEGGDLNSALNRLREAQQALEDALENGTEEDIRRAMDELRAAMDQYLREFARQMMQEGMQQAQPQQQNGDTLTQQDLNEMLDELQRRAEGGLRDEARDMLSELSRMLENLQMGQAQQGQPQQGGPGQQALQELQELIQRQRQLSDQTFGEQRRQQREGQQGQQGGQPQGGQPSQPGQGGQPGQQGQAQQGQQGQGQGQGQNSPGGQQGQGNSGQGRNGQLAQDQRALQQMLDELMGNLPGGEGSEAIRRALEGAGQSMGDAEGDLNRNAPGEAVDDQLRALDQLSQGAQELAQQLEQQGQGQQSAQGNGQGRGDGAEDDQADPFDRPSGRFGAIDGRDTDVPDRALMDRARELLDELRRRAGEATRPDYELDYLDRLLDQY
ncbi:MAG: TIGR02302 family protein [Pseudomonadota bacterium]